MNFFILVVLGLISVCTTHAYVYVQVQKGDKHTSNVDALIHKEVPSESVGEITEQLKETFHKKKLNKSKYKRFEVRKRADEKPASQAQGSRESKKDLDNVVLAVDTGVKIESTPRDQKSGVDLISKLLDAVKDFGTDSNSPLMRAREEYNIKPEVVQFRSGKPSLKLEVNSDSIVKLAREMLSSPTVRRYADELAQKAAIIFRVIKEELKKN